MADQGLAFGNDHCFEGVGRAFWLEKARGFSPKAMTDRTGKMLSYHLELDTDGHAKQEGGIFSPVEEKLKVGQYMYRFVKGDVVRAYASKSRQARSPIDRAGLIHPLAGGWWIDFEGFKLLRRFAQKNEHSLAQTAALCLVIPPDWGDCAFYGKALVRRRLRAWTGKGKSATGKVSPHQRKFLRDMVGASVYDCPPLIKAELKQYFIPGDPKTLESSLAMQDSDGIATALFRIPKTNVDPFVL